MRMFHFVTSIINPQCHCSYYTDLNIYQKSIAILASKPFIPLMHRAMLNQGFLLMLALVSLLNLVPLTLASSHLTVTAAFNQSGVRGGITFSQEGPNAPTIITVSLTGMECSLSLTH